MREFQPVCRPLCCVHGQTDTQTHTHTDRQTDRHTHTLSLSLSLSLSLLSPWIFQPIWAMIRPWIDPVTRQKFHVLGSRFADRLAQDLGAENLPAEYGGTADYTMPNTHPYEGPNKDLVS